jgi:hypothetical protein
VSATPAPSGTPMSPPKITAEKLTRSDRRTIASRTGSPVNSICSAETLSGMSAPRRLRGVAFRRNVVNFGS